MAMIMKNVVVHPSGRVSYRRVYPANLRPFIPGEPREFKVSLGRDGDSDFGSK
jgi:hypothetical protein